MPKSTAPLPDWEQLLSAAARLQKILPDAVLEQLESVAGWKTARIQPPVQILGSLDGIETGIRQLIRQEPLETEVITHNGQPLTVPTHSEILRIKGVLILRRNATRDYIDFAALADQLGAAGLGAAMKPFDRLYPQTNGESPLQQLQAQLANPLPYDLDETDLSAYKSLAPRWHDWSAVKSACAQAALQIFD